MDVKIIDKKEILTYVPNFPDYNTAYKDFDYKDVTNELVWFDQDKINAAYNAITRNALSDRKNKVALYWIGENDEKQQYTFLQVEERSNQIANYLKAHGIGKGDRVFIFLPRVPELFFTFIAILKIGAVAGSLFSAFGTQALYDRLDQSGAKALVTNSDLTKRLTPMRNQLKNLEHIFLIDKGFSTEVEKQSKELRVTQTHQEDNCFMLYTSGTTGKPKGVVHAHRSILHEYITAKWVLDIKESDVYWCTADPGWVTGIAYGILGSWANGASTVVDQGRFSPERWYKIIQDYKVNVWYTAPTAIRMLAASGIDVVKKYNLSSLRHICSVGEPLNPEPLLWGIKAFGLPFHDTYWQTETGGMIIVNYPSLPIKVGSMGKPFPGLKAHIVSDDGAEQPINGVGNITIETSWPSLMKEIWRRPKKYDSYFMDGHIDGKKKRLYVTGDLGFKDKDGYFWFVGRSDDVIKTAGERVGPFEVESAIVSYPGVIEAGVIGKPDALYGQIIKAFIVLKQGVNPSEALKKEIVIHVKKTLAGHAYPKEIEFIDRLPKTRSGKIMRRILKAKDLGLPIGDTSTLEEY